MHGNFGAHGKARNPGGEVLRANFFRYQRSGLDTVAAVDNRKRIDSQSMRFSHECAPFWKLVRSIRLFTREIRQIVLRISHDLQFLTPEFFEQSARTQIVDETQIVELLRLG